MKYIKLAIFAILLLVLLVAIVYRLIWPVTPPWLDFVVYGGGAIALLAGLSNKGNHKDREGH